jgi:hypothetical protein
MYYREQKDSINPQLLALKKKKNHQTSHPWASPDQSVRQLCACPKITKPPILGRPLINQLSNMGTPLSASKAKFYHLHTSTGLSPSTSHSLGLPPSSLSQQLILPPPTSRPAETHTPLHPSGVWWPQCAASGLSVDIWRPPRQSH